MEYFKQLITKMPFDEMVRAIMPSVIPILVVWALLITFLPSLTLR
jgi:TRAP-type C4-dicarboxylate transport system permease large subunit